MTGHPQTEDPPPIRPAARGDHPRRAERWVGAARSRYAGSPAEDLAERLKALDFANWIVQFGASLLMAVLPLIILLSSLADERIDDDLSRHIGLNVQGSHIVQGLFRTKPSHSASAIALGVIIGFAGTMAVASALQTVYERTFGQEPRGWRHVLRFVAWVLVLFGVLIAEGSYDEPLRSAAGVVVRAAASFTMVTLFFAWTMHFLLGGRVRWRRVVRPAVLTGLLWLGLALFSSLYFPSAIVSESRLYGPLGVVFIFLTWFIAIGAIILLGAVCGVMWDQRAERAGAARDDARD